MCVGHSLVSEEMVDVLSTSLRVKHLAEKRGIGFPHLLCSNQHTKP